MTFLSRKSEEFWKTVFDAIAIVNLCLRVWRSELASQAWSCERHYSVIHTCINRCQTNFSKRQKIQGSRNTSRMWQNQKYMLKICQWVTFKLTWYFKERKKKRCFEARTLNAWFSCWKRKGQCLSVLMLPLKRCCSTPKFSAVKWRNVIGTKYP